MSETTKITLGGVPYQVPRFHFGQRRRLAASPMSGTVEFAYDFLAVAMERADPRPVSFDSIEPTQDEIVAAIAALNTLNGFHPEGEAEAPGAATA